MQRRSRRSLLAKTKHRRTAGDAALGTTSYYQADGLGSLTSLSNAAGALAKTYTFDSFGNKTASTGRSPIPSGTRHASSTPRPICSYRGSDTTTRRRGGSSLKTRSNLMGELISTGTLVTAQLTLRIPSVWLSACTRFLSTL